MRKKLGEKAAIQRKILAKREEGLRRAKEEWERTFDSVPDLIAILDDSHRIVRANRAMAERLGVQPEECVGKLCFSCVHGTDDPVGSCPHVLTMADGREHLAEIHEHNLGGDFLVTTTPLMDEIGQMIGSVHVARDITERKQTEKALRESQEQVRRKLDSILSPEGEIADLELSDIIDTRSMQSLMDNFYKLTKMPMGLIDLSGKVLVGVGWQDVCTKFHRIHPEACRSCIESDTQLSAGVPPGEYKLYKCKNNLWDVATPVMIGGKHFGNIFMGQFFFMDEPLDYEYFYAQAQRYGFEKDKYIAALESVPRLTRESLDAGMAYFMELADMVSRMSYSNIKLARSLSERDALMVAVQKAHDGLEQRVRERTEELASTIEVLLGEITERQRAEEGLQRLNLLYEVLSETNQAIVRVADRDSLFHDFCRIAVEHGGFLLSWVGLADETSGQVTTVAACGATTYLEDIRITTQKEPVGEGPTGTAIREGTYRICNDFQNDPCTRPWHERGRAYGIRSSAAIALREDGRVIGALTLYAREKDFFDQQHLGLLQQMSTDISFALDNLKRENRRREAELALHAETLARLRTAEALREKDRLLMHQSRLAAMGEMINSIAHQWRQPLNVLGLNIQSLMLLYDLKNLTREVLRNSTDDAMKLVNHMSQTIDDFRNFFKSDKEKTDFSVNQAIQLTVSLINDGLKYCNIEMATRIEGNPVINGYYNEFCQVLLNILQNASDVIKERSIAGGKIIIAATAENGRTIITITDNAGGIPEEISGRIFEPYFSTKGVQGTGIGLFMSKNIIETNMGGSISVRNISGGAEFRIEV